MKKRMFLIVALAVFSLSSLFGQLKVVNNFGKDLMVTVNGQKNLISYRGVKVFSTRSSQNVWLECVTLDAKIKFSVSKDVSRAGLVTIESSDNSSSVQTQVQTQSYSPSVSHNAVVSEVSTGSLAGVLGQVNVSSTSNITSNNNVSGSTNTTVTNTVVRSQIDYGRIPLVYTGAEKFKVFSEIGRGLEFSGADSADVLAKSVRNSYVLAIPRNQDLVIGVGIKEGENQAIWRYAEIRKWIGLSDTACVISQNDIKQMSTNENKKLRIKLTAEKYKIFFDPGTGAPISIGFNELSRSVDVPIGQFYIRISFTDAAGMFHRTVFVPKHVTKGDRNLEITKNDLENAVKLNWSQTAN
jgi:hypothetical protein